HAFQVRVGVFGKAVDSHDHRHTESLQVLNVPGEVGESAFQVAFALVAQTLHCRHQDSARRGDPGRTHDDIQIFFCAEIGGKAGLVDNIIGQANAHVVRDYTAGAMGD